MFKDNLPERLFYVDVIFERLADSKIKNQWSKEKIKLEFDKIKEEAENLDVDGIRSKLISDDLHWFNRFANVKADKIRINTHLLCIDDGHEGIKLCGIEHVKRGDLLKDIVTSGSDKRVDSLLNSPHIEFLISHFPIVVRKYGDLFEVMSGNHRALTLIQKDIKEIEVLLIK